MMDFKEGEVLFFNKPLGWTSFKVVGHARYHICSHGWIKAAVIAQHRVNHRQGVLVRKHVETSIHNIYLLGRTQKAAVDGVEF